MSDLETKARPVLEPLINADGGIVELTRDEAELLALWGFKTAVVINAASNYRIIIPEDHVKVLDSVRALPRRLKVDLALGPRIDDLAWLQGQSAAGTLTRSRVTDKLLSSFRSAYVITLSVGGVIIRLANLPKARFKVERPVKFESWRLHPHPGGVLEIEAGNRDGDLGEMQLVVFRESKRRRRSRKSNHS